MHLNFESHTRQADKLSLFLVVGLMILSSSWLGFKIHKLQELQMDMDEAIHATRGLDIALAVMRGSLSELWSHTTKPHWYPPGHGFMLGGWFLGVGANIFTARLYSTFCYFLFGFVLWLSAKQVAPQAHPIVYLVPPLFLLTDRLHTVYAGMSMLEVPAILCAWVGILFWNLANHSHRRVYHFLAALISLLCFFIKYNYGLVIFAALLTSYIWSAPWKSPNRLRAWGMNISIAWAPLGLLLVIWLFGLGEWRWLKAYASAQPPAYELWSVANLAYYPRFLWSTLPSQLAILLAGVRLTSQLKKRQLAPTLIPNIFFFCFGLLMLTYKLKNEPRFGMLLLPPVWIYATTGLIQIADYLRNRIHPNTFYLVIVFILAVVALKNHHDLSTHQLRQEYENTNGGVDAAYAFIANTIEIANQQSTTIVMLGRSDQWNGPALRFRLESQCMLLTDCRITVLDDKEIAQGWPRQDFSTYEQERRYQEVFHRADWVVLFSSPFPEYEQWKVIAKRDFTFQRHTFPPSPVQVTILTHQ